MYFNSAYMYVFSNPHAVNENVIFRYTHLPEIKIANGV